MAKPFDRDRRIRIIAAVNGGMSCQASARHFSVSASAVIKLMARYRATGSLKPGQMGGHRPRLLEGERDWVLARIGEQADITIRALADEPAERGIVVSHVSAKRTDRTCTHGKLRSGSRLTPRSQNRSSRSVSRIPSAPRAATTGSGRKYRDSDFVHGRRAVAGVIEPAAEHLALLLGLGAAGAAQVVPK
jgi:transposase